MYRSAQKNSGYVTGFEPRTFLWNTVRLLFSSFTITEIGLDHLQLKNRS